MYPLSIYQSSERVEPTSLELVSAGEWMQLPEAVWWSLALLVIALLLAVAFSVLLRREVKEQTRRLRESESRLNTILNSVEACIYIKDRELRYQYANSKTCTSFGTTEEEIIGKTDDAFFDADTCHNLRRNDLGVLNGVRFSSEEVNHFRYKDETHVFFSDKMPLRTPNGSIYALCGVSTDITEHRHIQEQLHQITFFDTLTGLPNRRRLNDSVRHALACSARTGYEGAVVMVDLDNFRTVNDSMGHETGDQLLCQVAERLLSRRRSTDTLARPGADEYVVVLEDLCVDKSKAVLAAMDVASDWLMALTRPYSLDGAPYVLTVSIGIIMFSDADGDTEALLKGLDLALYAAKSAGRNRIQFFNPVMQQEVNHRTQMESALRRAIEAGALELHVQPQVNSEGAIVAMEALTRWNDPELGVISPAEFIPLAEESGLIVPLGEWVLERACEILQEWSKHPPFSSLVLAINISPAQFRHISFVEHIEQCLDRSGVDPSLLELEITESLLIDALDLTIERMKQLAARGMRFALDDFGTGYASLVYLKHLPLQLLKIDKSFIQDLLTDNSDAAIVRTVLSLGENMELRVLAEGVETVEQVQCLRDMGCKFFQGYLHGKPAPLSTWQSDSRLQPAV